MPIRPRHFGPLLALLSFSLVGCPKKNDPSGKNEAKESKENSKKDKKGDDEKSGEGEEEKSDDETPKSKGAGCKPPSPIEGQYTITKGCKVAVKQNLEVAEGGTLIIEKGARIAFDDGVRLAVWNAKLVAKGTDDEPIVFTSAHDDPHPGAWTGIVFGKPRNGTTLDHVEVSYAGHDGNYGEGAITFYEEAAPNRVTITNSTIQKNLRAGVTLHWNGPVFAKFEGNKLKDNGKVSMKLAPDAVGSIGKNTFSEPIRVLGGHLLKSATWADAGVPFVVEANLEIRGETDPTLLTLPDGATLKFVEGAHLMIGGGDVGGGLVAKNVVFTSNNTDPAPGDWTGIVILPHATKTKIEGGSVEFAGKEGNYGHGAITFYEASPKKLGARVKISDIALKKSETHGIFANDTECGGLEAAGNKVDKGKLCKLNE